MTLILQQVLPAQDVARVRAGLTETVWKSGKTTAGAQARQVKWNEQANHADPHIEALERFVRDALQAHPMFALAARPARLSRIMFSRYQPDMEYGAHTDDALMGAGSDPLRTDLAFTIFIEESGAYEGGALVIESAMGEQSVKLEAGDAFLYPAGSIHRVEPVTSGARLAAVGWVQSLVADPSQRDILFELSVARARLAEAGAARAELLSLDRVISNLLRMWARP
jgi:PKHD-type hydroxylase